MKDVLCIICGKAAAFPNHVEKPFTCIECQHRPTNEPKMPEVIYALCFHHFQLWGNTPDAEATSYTRTDKVQELREALRECVDALTHIRDATKHSCEQTRNSITKALNLLK